MLHYIKILLFIIVSVGTLSITSCSKDSTSIPNVGADGSRGTGKGGSLARFTIYGSYLYMVDFQSLKTYDISNPDNPVMMGNTPIGFGIETIYPYNGNLFIGSNTAMYIYSLADPKTPTMQGMAQHVQSCDPVVAQGDYAYVTIRAGNNCGGNLSALLVYNVKTLSSPILLKEILLTSPYGLGISDQTLYVCDGNAGLVVYDVATPNNPVMQKKIEGHFFKDCIPYGDILICMVADGMVIYDISTRDNPLFVTKITS